MKKIFFTLALLSAFAVWTTAQVQKAQKINPTTVEVLYADGQRLTIDFYADHIFRLFQDNDGGILRNPEANPPAQILVDNPRKSIGELTVTDDNATVAIETSAIAIHINKQNTLIEVTDKNSGKIAIQSLSPFHFSKKNTSWELKAHDHEYFYGGGVQNGRFSHKGKVIAIENQNSWTDGGVASPNPFYWSTEGYAIMWHTFKKGTYDFGSKEKNSVKLSHDTDYLDLFVMVNEGAVALLNDFYQLTGNPVLLPKFGFYEGHLNAYNRDYWTADEKGIPFEDGKSYKESQKDNGGIRESLNGELGNYQFSARAVIDRYKAHDMPLGWLLPNDGYGAGYGQTETLDGNIANLKSLADYAHQNGVEIGLWTQSDLHPKAEISPLLQRDIVKEVRDAKVRVLKTDVAWVGAGYSFGLNGVADVAHIMPYYGDNARPFIISLDGWAGTQRYAGIWSGDQSGGKWEYIRFHIPTYIGSGLSGNPNISSDMDGIFGGKNAIVNIRDFQWKTFTPMQLNMDGWGANPKYPHILGEPAASINRHYLKLKAELMPYTYSIAHQAIDGLPIIRAMFLEYPNDYTLGKATQYQFLFGENFLIAPIYQNTKSDTLGNDIRNGIYLPEGTWIDYFSGEKYTGNRIINHFDVPIWKLPIFVKAGAIIPMNNPHNNPKEIDENLRIFELYPYGESQFICYDDDGKTEAYRNGAFATTAIKSTLDKDKNLTITIAPTVGNFNHFVQKKRTELRINTTSQPKKIAVKVGGKTVKLKAVKSINDFENNTNVFYYNPAPNLNQFATKGSDFEQVKIIKNPQLWIKIGETDITQNQISVALEAYEFEPQNTYLTHTGTLATPTNAQVTEGNREAYTLTPTWDKVANADYYEILFNQMTYSTIKENALLFENLSAETNYDFKLRAVNQSGVSDWTSFQASTKSNPLEFALRGIKAETSCHNQGGQGIQNLFDFDEGTTWHTQWGVNSLPFEIVIDLTTVNTLDKMHYLPRQGGGNGVLLVGEVAISHDKATWTKVGNFHWDNNGNVKVFDFTEKPTARFLKISVSKGVGGFGSGQQLYIFKVPGTESFLPGDINHDRLVDMNDFTSYLNYTGLRQGDADFEGYVSNGDLNKNGLIDAYDISVVATRLRGGVSDKKTVPLAGKITLQTDKKSYQAGETVQLTVSGEDLQSVNALSMSIDYDPQAYEFVGIVPLAVKQMENMTNDRLHTNGKKALYPTFVNMGDKPSINGTNKLFIVKFKAKRNGAFDLHPNDILLIDKELNVLIR